MNRKYLAFASAVAAFVLSALIILAWMKPFSVGVDKQQISQSYKLYCSVPTSSSIRLADSRPTITGFGNSSALLLSEHSEPLSNRRAFERYQVQIDNLPRPLWLLNRSLLI